MVSTDHQAKYVAHLLTQRHPSDSPDKLAGALVDAQVDLHPHQVEAALFAFRSPFSKGALLADEVGLGKTIEAGLVIAQKWAERKRKILVITPANLRKQWYQELQEKFFLPSTILETKAYNAQTKVGNFSPFEVKDSLVICSYQFAKAKASDVSRVDWDLVVLDEAHRLRNVYKPNNVIANTIKLALQNDPKLLLTATPLQNSLLELFGLVSIIDEHAFGDFQSFRDQYARLQDERVFEILKNRLKPICHRTLRRQVTQYVSYTARHAMVEEFTPGDAEVQLYDDVSEYLQRDNLMALPNSQRALMTLVLRKLLASSTFAIAGALDTLINRLEKKLKKEEAPIDLVEEFDKDYEALDEVAEEFESDAKEEEPLTQDEVAALRIEIEDLKRFRDLAVSIVNNAKGKALLKALKRAFDETERLGGKRKAIVFTESRKTQDYLVRMLSETEYADGLVLFNGSNTDERSRAIYQDYVKRHEGTDHVTGSRTADMRSAIVEYFKNEGQIMIATEAGAEGINLQFCSLVVNYDLPWNPQRIEQRIGRCHRYGQKHDVVVLNFVNLKNEADKRVYELLNEKFKLFSGVFGASDEVLGAIESGVDLEKRIADIYQKCRTTAEIKDSFDELQLELDFEIKDAMKQTRVQLLENFDQEVHEKLKLSKDQSEAALNRFEQMLMDVTRHELKDHAEFTGDGSFCLHTNPCSKEGKDIPLGLYELPRRSGEAHYYRMSHPLALELVRGAQERDVVAACVFFDYKDTPGVVSILVPYLGMAGELAVSLLTVDSLDQSEDYFVYAGVTDDGQELDDEVVRRMLFLKASIIEAQDELCHSQSLESLAEIRQRAVTDRIAHRNLQFFDQEQTKLDGWADDLKVGLEREIKDFDRQIKEAKRASSLAGTLELKLEAQKLLRKLESDRNTKRRSLFEAQDAVDRRHQELIEEIEGKLQQSSNVRTLIQLKWRL